MKKKLIRDLGDGLVLRQATRRDSSKLADFNARIHSDEGFDKPDERLEAWTRDLMEIPHPTFKVGDFTIVEDTRTGKIVSSLNLISQTWEFSGLPFKVGRPELVGTLPEYRNRGLVRAQFEVIHEWSARRGELVQAITGIPYYYRLFGYEMALDLGGGRVGFRPHVPALKEGEEEPYRLRPATVEDIPFIMEMDAQMCRRSLVSCQWDEALWRYELTGKREKNVNRHEHRIIETNDGTMVGHLAHAFSTWGPTIAASAYEIKPGYSWAHVSPTVVRYLFATGKEYAIRDGRGDQFDAFAFWFGREHPIFQVMVDRLPRVRQPYAWYIRVPDLPGFLGIIRPVLEQRLSSSALAGHSGELRLTFYRAGLRLVFEAGHLTQVESWKPQPLGHSGDAAFPELTFLQLLFGYRSFQELCFAFPDVWSDHDLATALLNCLFPKQASHVNPVS